MTRNPLHPSTSPMPGTPRPTRTPANAPRPRQDAPGRRPDDEPAPASEEDADERAARRLLTDDERRRRALAVHSVDAASEPEALPRGVRRVDDPPIEQIVGVSIASKDRRATARKGLRWLFAAVFAFAGIAKLTGAEAAAAAFEAWGYPPWAMYAVGAVEVIAAALMVGGVLVAGAGLVIALMTGALVTHLLAGEWLAALLPLALLVLAFGLLRLTRPARVVDVESTEPPPEASLDLPRS